MRTPFSVRSSSGDCWIPLECFYLSDLSGKTKARKNQLLVRYSLKVTIRIPLYSRSCSIARSPVTMRSALTAAAHSSIRLSGSSARTDTRRLGATIFPSSAKNTAARASSSLSRLNFLARTERTSSIIALEMSRWSSPETTFSSANSARPPGRTSAETKMLESNTTFNSRDNAPGLSR